MTNGRSVPLVVRVPAEMRAGLDAMAAATGLTRSAAARLALGAVASRPWPRTSDRASALVVRALREHGVLPIGEEPAREPDRAATAGGGPSDGR